jgi:hypothetical protein
MKTLWSKVNNFNSKFASLITKGVATMWCAYAFVALTLVSLPATLKTHNAVDIVQWIAQTFLQLVLLSIIMVGQNQASAGVEQKINETHAASLGEFELAKEARLIAHQELAELHEIAKEIRRLLKDVEGTSKK